MSETNSQTHRRGISPIPLVLSGLLVLMIARTGLAQDFWAPSPFVVGAIHNTNPGNVGIGTMSPSEKLTLFDGSLLIQRPSGSSAPAGFHLYQANVPVSAGWWSVVSRSEGAPWDAARLGFWNGAVGSDVLSLFPNGNVAIGTSSPGNPSQRLELVKDNADVAMRFHDPDDAWYTIGINRAANGLFSINRGPSPAFTPDITINPSTGNVGIGTATAATRLHVAGDVTVSGNIAAKYQDLAEWVPARERIAAGTVVVLDTERSNTVLPSDRPYDTRVAGIVSRAPGILLGERGAGKIKVATAGRVKVKADATGRPIRVGDLLVTSGTRGMAMRSEPIDLAGTPIHRPGTLVGKALEPLVQGQGEILVLLSLQ